MRNQFIVFSTLSLVITAAIAFFLWTPMWIVFFVLVPLILLGLYDYFQKANVIRRNFPLLGRGRHLMEELRPKIQQYFIEPDTEGKPFNRLEREMIYARANKSLDTTPFGTQMDLYAEGYEWMNHSIASLDPHHLDPDPRVTIGGPYCKQPYSASMLNISAMSFGSLSSAAIEALNGGAKIRNFAHNTGEGGISPYHDKYGGDLIYQIGTGYFGCRAKDGNIDWDAYVERTKADNVKMIELKLSQGAKPGHGGILPAKKVTPEIAKIRGIEQGKDVHSPPYHKSFDSPIGLLKVIRKMQDLSGGKPVGFKFCVGSKSEFFAICKAMVETKITPDFISVDGGEGGTGAAPLEFSNFVGMPFKEGLVFVHDALVGYGLKKDIKIITSGKITSGFDMYRAIALGADLCYSARAMMLSLGCIQALECNKNTCPTGVATQIPSLVAGLVVSDKKVKVASFHKETIESFVELLAASGLQEPAQINRRLINRRVFMNLTKNYAEIYPYVEEGCFLTGQNIPDIYRHDLEFATAKSFA